MYLLDTNVVSELRKTGSGKADARVIRWADSVDANSLYLSAMTVLELEYGALQMERKDARQGALLRTWLESRVFPEFEARTLPVDAVIARRCASLHTPDRKAQSDALIAATALVHGMTVVTRNVADFRPTGVKLLNPWN